MPDKPNALINAGINEGGTGPGSSLVTTRRQYSKGLSAGFIAGGAAATTHARSAQAVMPITSVIVRILSFPALALVIAEQRSPISFPLALKHCSLLRRAHEIGPDRILELPASNRHHFPGCSPRGCSLGRCCPTQIAYL